MLSTISSYRTLPPTPFHSTNDVNIINKKGSNDADENISENIPESVSNKDNSSRVP